MLGSFKVKTSFKIYDIKIEAFILFLEYLTIFNYKRKSVRLRRYIWCSNGGALFAEVNGKKEFIKQLSELSIKCTDVFLGYDDHSLIFKEARRIEIEKEDKHIPIDFKQLFDSIKASSGNKYHQIIFDIKDGNCNNK